MSISSVTIRTRRFLAGGALGAALVLGSAGAAGAQDEHSGGVSPNQGSADPGGPAEVGGETVTRGGGLPVTGSDVAGLVAVGGTALVVGAAAVAVSRRRSTSATA